MNNIIDNDVFGLERARRERKGQGRMAASVRYLQLRRFLATEDTGDQVERGVL